MHLQLLECQFGRQVQHWHRLAEAALKSLRWRQRAQTLPPQLALLPLYCWQKAAVVAAAKLLAAVSALLQVTHSESERL